MTKQQTTRQHWEHIYQTKNSQQVSWTQDYPEPSLQWIAEIGLDPKECIVDAGGGRSQLARLLVEAGHQCIEVFDISMRALAQAKLELQTAEAREAIHYRVCDVQHYAPDRAIGLWHDRAVFHFLTDPEAVASYVRNVLKMAPKFVLLGTFSPQGPEKCSGLPVRRYSPEALTALFISDYETLRSEPILHHTPSGGEQAFSFVLLRHREVML